MRAPSKAANASVMANLVQKREMPEAKTCFGVCFDSGQTRIYTVGGRGAAQVNSATCHVYDIEKDEWTALPELQTALYSLSCSLFKNDRWLYAMGGINANDILVKSI